MKNYKNAKWISVIQIAIWMRGTSVSPGQVVMIMYSSSANDFLHTWQCVVKIYHIISRKKKSATETLVDKLVFILYAKFFLGDDRYHDKIYIYNKSSYEQRT